MNSVCGHDADEGDKMWIGEGLCTSFVVFDQSSESCCPCEGLFDHPSAREENEASLGVVEFDDLQCNAVLASGLGGLSSE